MFTRLHLSQTLLVTLVGARKWRPLAQGLQLEQEAGKHFSDTVMGVLGKKWALRLDLPQVPAQGQGGHGRMCVELMSSCMRMGLREQPGPGS